MTKDVDETKVTGVTGAGYYYKCAVCGRDRRELAAGLKDESEDGKKEAVEALLGCVTCSSALYKAFRQATGHCETCRAPLGDHKKCYLCSIFLGPGHESEGSPVNRKDPDKLWCGYCHKKTSRKVALEGSEPKER